jgi:hypothetical protein
MLTGTCLLPLAIIAFVICIARIASFGLRNANPACGHFGSCKIGDIAHAGLAVITLSV